MPARFSLAVLAWAVLAGAGLTTAAEAQREVSETAPAAESFDFAGLDAVDRDAPSAGSGGLPGACPSCQRHGGEDTSPGWYVQAESLFLRRNSGSALQPVVIDRNSDTTILATRDLRFDAEAGPRLTLGRWFDPCSAWELSYFGMHHWNSQATAVGDNNLSIPGDLGLALLDFNQADAMRLDYSAELHNAELNYLRSLDNMTLVAGFRYLRLTERFNIHAIDSDTGASDYNIQAANDLYGGQIGARVARGSGRLGWEFTSKAGLFGNNAKQRTFLADFDNTRLERDSQTRGGQVAFVGELGLSGTYQLTRVLTVRGGYNLMWIAGVALAPDQLDFTDLPSSGTALDRGGGIFLHGANVGLEARW
jgi:hypothetical protein